MSIWTVLFVLAFVAMIAMHLRGHAGHGGGHGHRHDDRHDDNHVDSQDTAAPDTRPAEDATQPVGGAEPHGGHGRHRHGC